MRLRTRLCIVAHALELERTTNTGTVAARLVEGSSVAVHGQRSVVDGVVRDAIAAVPDFTGRRALVLFPTEQAEELTPAHAANAPVTLVVPDGTWTQARRMHHRIPWMQGLQHVCLPASDRRSAYLLRASVHENRLATMEAIAVALGILEGAQVQHELERVFRLLVERTMIARGTPIKAKP